VSAPTTLVTVAHGTRIAAGNDVARELTDRAGALLPAPAVCSFVELAEPLVSDVVATLAGPTVVVPLLLSTGFHVRHDLPAACAGAPAGVEVRLGRPLGPDPLLAAAQVERLRSAGAEPDQPVVMVAAGSRDPLATEDLERAAVLLGEAWGAPVRLATLSGLGRRPAAVVGPGDAVSPYLLAEGFFAQRCRQESSAAAVVGEVVGAHERVVELVLARARALSDG
jgi:sirohydrochlorin ferrochelatase